MRGLVGSIIGMPPGRPYSTATPLGRKMSELGLSKQEVVAATYLAGAGVHERTMSHYLAGTKPFQPHHLRALAELLEVDPSELEPTLA